MSKPLQDLLRRFLALALLAMTAHLMPALAQSGGGAGADTGTSPQGGPIRLRQPQQAPPAGRAALAEGPQDTDVIRDRTDREPEYKPGEFEVFIRGITNDPDFRRFGADLGMDRSTKADAQEFNPAVPPDYLIAPGDELVVTIWGSVDADLRLVVDRTGRIHIPRVGSMLVAGKRFIDLNTIVEQQVARVFRNFQLSVSLGQLRSVRVFVTGFATRPGAYTAGSLATVSSVLFNRAGGPSASGSFRNIEVRRGGKSIATMDLYDLLLHGQRESDVVVQADDVIHVNPVGKEVALIGSVNKPAIFELKPGETLGSLLRMGGGFGSVADRSRMSIERLEDRNDRRVRQVPWPGESDLMLDAGDVVRVFSAVAARLPLERQNKRVLVEGEVQRPGVYVLPPESTITDALHAAGGLTPAAFVYGTEFSRGSTRLAQQANYERALRDLELEVSRRSASSVTRTAEEVAGAAAQQQANERLLQRLREAKPTGRVVLQLASDARELPPLALEDGDRLYVPPFPMTVGIFGSVFNAGTYLYGGQRAVGDYLRLAGSPTRGADMQSVFVVRANGSVISAQQQSGWRDSARFEAFATQPVQPGDTIFVPEDVNKTTFMQNAKDWTQIIYQLGIGVAALLAIGF